MNATSAPQIEFVREADANGVVADIFADIRTTMAVATVNLIWRHLAIEPLVLEGAWMATRPMYTSARLDQHVAAFAADVSINSGCRWPSAVLALAGVMQSERATVASVIATYNRGNAYNLLTLSALLTAPNEFKLDAASGARTLPSPAHPLPPVPEMHELDHAVAGVVMELNQLGNAAGGASIIATLYKHLAHWPGLLNLAWAALAPLHRDGTLQAMSNDCAVLATRHAGALAVYRGAWPAGPARDKAEIAISMFVQHAICRLLPVGLLLRQALEPN